MKTRRGRPLKVFQAQFGFYDVVVAAPSQVAALRIWGTHQNLFADGQARVADDPKAIEAALAHPETLLRRPVGTATPFAVDPTGLPEVPEAGRTPRAKVPPKKPVKAQPAPKAPADRSALASAEAALKVIDDERKREEAELRRQQQGLEVRQREAQAAYVQARKAATAAVVNARQAYRKSGGRD